MHEREIPAGDGPEVAMPRYGITDIADFAEKIRFSLLLLSPRVLVEKIRACGGIDFDLPILLGYSGLSGESLETYVEYSHDLWERGTEILDKTCISGVIGTHTGPGVVAAAFFRKH